MRVFDLFSLNKIRDKNDEGDFSDRREIMYRIIPISIGMFEKVVQDSINWYV